MAYTDHNDRPDNPRSVDCQVCGTNHIRPRLTRKHCFCNSCLVVTPHVPLEAPRPECTICNTCYSSHPPADEHGQRLRQFAELELNQLQALHPVKYGQLRPIGGYVAALSANNGPSDVPTSTGV